MTTNRQKDELAQKSMRPQVWWMQRVQQLLLRRRFTPAPVVDNSPHGRPMLQVSGGTMRPDCHHEETCSVVPAGKGLSERICSYRASVHLRSRDGLPTRRLLHACGHSKTQGPSNAASLSLQLMQSLKSMSTFLKTTVGETVKASMRDCAIPRQGQAAR